MLVHEASDHEQRAELRRVTLGLFRAASHDDIDGVYAGLRPLLAGDEEPLERWQTLLAERQPLYRAVATVTVPATNGPPSTIVFGKPLKMF